jgi:hypothetical protein
LIEEGNQTKLVKQKTYLTGKTRSSKRKSDPNKDTKMSNADNQEVDNIDDERLR